jgi:hypothetical protein
VPGLGAILRFLLAAPAAPAAWLIWEDLALLFLFRFIKIETSQ